MKHECEVIRDLMPLCIDDTASGKTREMVDEHVAECKPCEQVYGEMKSAVDIPAPRPQENPEFERAVRRMKTRRKRRTWLTLLLGVVLTIAVAATGLGGYYWYFEEDVLMESAQLTLVMSNDGIGLIHASNVPRSAYVVLQYSVMAYPEAAQGQYEVCAYVYATRYAARNEADDVYYLVGNVTDGQVLLDDKLGGEIPVYRMLLGSEDGSGQVFYLSGEDVPERISLKGAYLKSPERTYYGSGDTPVNRAWLRTDYGSGNASPLPYATPTPTIRPPSTQATETLPATTLTPTPEL